MERHLIVVAGGTGTRMRTPVAKQFIELEGLPLMWWTLRRFRAALGDDLDVTLVLFDGLFDTFKELEQVHGPAGTNRIVPGGAERFHSVQAGLAALPNSGVVGIHDAVRPFVDVETIRRCYATAAGGTGCAIPVVPVKDSIREVHGAGSHALDRSGLRAVQTPQCFDLGQIKGAYNVPYDSRFTDDASVFEYAGHAITLVDGNPENIKVTTPEDLVIASAFLNS